MSGDLHTKYRPTTLKQVIGQDSAVSALRTVVRKNQSHAFLLTGEAGVGKTTLARILAREVNCLPANVLEVDAATVTGIDAMRAITDGCKYRGFGESPNKAIILDEAHRLSAAAFASLLKSLEEPPEHIYWFLCTTEHGKIPKTIRSRCVAANLKPIAADDLITILKGIVEQEGLEVDEEIIELCARQAEGSARQAITFLAACQGAQDRREAKKLIEAATEGKTVIDLCRFLLYPQPRTWPAVMKLLTPLREEPPESLRIVMVNYFNAILVPKADSDRKPAEGKTVLRALEVMQHFIDPFPQQNGFASLTMAVGKALFGHAQG